jgi:hypothetical protein
MNQRNNNIYMIKMWITIICFGAFVMFGIFKSLSTNIFYVMIPLLVLMILYSKRQAKDKINNALQKDNPYELIDVISKPLKSIKQKNLKESFFAYNTSFAYVLYGEFEKANEIMNQVDWEAMEPMFRALEFNIKSLIDYFNGEIHNGLANARKAKELATTASAFPGVKKSMVAYEAYIEIIISKA